MRSTQTSIFLALSQLCAYAAASFSSSSKSVNHGSDFLLQWDAVNVTDYPLTIRTRFINQTSQYGVNSLEADITTGLNATAFLWENVPYPLPYLDTALYEVEIWSQSSTGSTASEKAFASSSYFKISDIPESRPSGGIGDSSNETIIIPSNPSDRPASKGGVNNNTAIAAGLVVPVVVILAVLGFVWMQQRQKRAIEEKRKQRGELYID
ncbi:hypothetical protein M426DRAFT_18496 [Hypoxylon sp. CI-4A]|nr:hypothetical protein M426DRAFT_18496 [Hypoxylon sp. CI-4A]